MTEKSKHILVSFGGTTLERFPQFFVRVPSVLSHWRGFLSGARCRLAYSPADATATHSLASVNPDWFYLSGTGSPV